jgi:hypothetical protein
MSIKPLMHWIIYKGYTVRFIRRQPHEVAGLLTTPEGQVFFRYETEPKRIHLPDTVVDINQHGWELAQDARGAEEGEQ